MDLRAWHQRLAEHFNTLAHDRKDIPVFALEHGLAQAELLALQSTLRAHIKVAEPSGYHLLVWVVYAAEIGYGYAGNEYWQTFEDKTPGWTLNGKRDWIRDAFYTFQKKFSGAKPSGPWAEQFSIIAWPITHAILPRDLQQQLARILYELRHAFSAELFDEPQRLGDFIAARSWNTSARFQNLVQAPALVGQIAAALLLQGHKTLLHPMTLKRISDDVDRERSGRDWLRSARRAAEERAKIRGLTIGRSTNTTIANRDAARAEVERLGIEPRLVLRPSEESRWEVLLEIPDLSHLLFRFPQVREILTESRCTVAGAAGRPLARGRCLHGSQRVTLNNWPRHDDVLLKFERTDPQLEYLLRAECMLRPGSSWLFKVASDGLAYESRGMRVRAGGKYILVSTEPLASSTLARNVDVTCQGVHAVLLNVPSALTREWEQALRQFQITQAKSIEVWPAGLAAIAWDGEGHGEWLASESPTLAISSDHAIDELTVATSHGPSLTLGLTDTPLGEPVFIELPPLPVGLHKFSVSARSGIGPNSVVIGDLDVVMRVREARSWSPGATMHGPLEVELDPAAPSLEQLWDGKATIFVRGPVGRQAKCHVKMFAQARVAPIFDRQMPPITLPLSNKEWDSYFVTHLKMDKIAPCVYDDAQVCEIVFSADELGVFTLRCEREYKPLRWTLRRDTADFIVSLHDDAGRGVPAIERYSFGRPTVSETLTQVTEHRVPSLGGLYSASIGEFKASIIVPPIVRDLKDLQCRPQIHAMPRTPESITTLLPFAQLWGEARLSGDLIAGAHRVSVLRAMAAHIFALLGGTAWATAESLLKDERGLDNLRRAITDERDTRNFGLVDHMRNRTIDRNEQDFGAQLLANYKELANKPPKERASRFALLALNFNFMPPALKPREVIDRSISPNLIVKRRLRPTGPEHSPWLAEFVLRMASNPATLNAWAGNEIDASVNKLLNMPSITRAARFLVLAIDKHKNSTTAAGEIYAGWGWQE